MVGITPVPNTGIYSVSDNAKVLGMIPKFRTGIYSVSDNVKVFDIILNFRTGIYSVSLKERVLGVTVTPILNTGMYSVRLKEDKPDIILCSNTELNPVKVCANVLGIIPNFRIGIYSVSDNVKILGITPVSSTGAY